MEEKQERKVAVLPTGVLLLGTVAHARNTQTEKALDKIQEGLGAVLSPPGTLEADIG